MTRRPLIFLLSLFLMAGCAGMNAGGNKKLIDGDPSKTDYSTAAMHSMLVQLDADANGAIDRDKGGTNTTTAAGEQTALSIDHLFTLSGRPEGSNDLGTGFTGTTIPNSSNIVEALQALESAIEEGLATTDITSLSSGDYKTFYSLGGGAPLELALGAAGTYLRFNGATSAPTAEAIPAGDLPAAIDPDKIGTDGTANDKVEAENLNIQSMDISIAANVGTNDSYSGMPITGINAGETITKRQMVYYDVTAGEWLLADADAAGEAPAWGVAVSAGGDGQAISVLQTGWYRYDSWTWTPGAKLYLSDTAGGLTETAPSTSQDIVQPVAIAKSATYIMLMVNPVTGYARVE